jgi:hypothetical protein
MGTIAFAGAIPTFFSPAVVVAFAGMAVTILGFLINGVFLKARLDRQAQERAPAIASLTSQKQAVVAERVKAFQTAINVLERHVGSAEITDRETNTKRPGRTNDNPSAHELNIAQCALVMFAEDTRILSLMQKIVRCETDDLYLDFARFVVLARKEMGYGSDVQPEVMKFMYSDEAATLPPGTTQSIQ